jgi:flavin reductase (DIM6/NTAB) family NADH-FMN oxidoreductase RutF
MSDSCVSDISVAEYPPSRKVAKENIAIVRESNMLSRLLYPNPVCLLTVRQFPHFHAAESSMNELPTSIMTISWLTAVDNLGTFFMSMNKGRHTAKSMLPNAIFVLNVPSADMEKVVINVGSISGGTHTDKVKHLGIATCRPGWPSPDPEG